MRLAFPTLGQVDTNGTAEALALHQMRLRDKKATALIEIGLGGQARLLVLYAHGTQAGAYRDNGERCESIPLTDALANWKGGSIRIIPLPDRVTRAAWLSCELAKRGTISGRDQGAWVAQLNAWNGLLFDGVVSAESESTQAILLIQKGQPVESESAWMRSGEQIPLEGASMNGAWSAIVLEASNANPSGHCLALRQAAQAWSRGIFESYQNIAGEKILHVMMREVQAQIRPWQWNIRIEEGGINDEHFFPSAENASHAYRAIFMGMGAQMGFAIGSYITQRILGEMYEELSDTHRASLEAQRLIPAAFAE